MLNKVNTTYFPVTGDRGTSIDELCTECLKIPQPYIQTIKKCTQCGYRGDIQHSSSVMWDYTLNVWKDYPVKLGSHKNRTIQEWLGLLWKHKCQTKCPSCRSYLIVHSKVTGLLPHFIVFSVSSVSVNISPNIFIRSYRYNIIGLIYFGGFHFVSCIIEDNRSVWFSDGIAMRRKCILEGNIVIIDGGYLQKVKGKTLCCIIYMLA